MLMGAVELSDETINKLANQILQLSSSVKKNESEKKLRNIEVLLMNYKYLENHIYVDLPPLEQDMNIPNSELSLYSLLGYRARSKELMEFVNSILSRYREICEGSSDSGHRRYDVIYSLYLAEKQLDYNDLAKKYNVDEKTIRRDRKKAIEQLSVMMFGADGLNDMSK